MVDAYPPHCRDCRESPKKCGTCRTGCVKECQNSTSTKVKSPIGILWTLLSIVVAGTCSFSFLQPHWFVEPDTENSFGMFSYCIATSESPYSTYQTRSHRQMHIRTDISRAARKQNCGIYGGSFQFSNLPSNSWQASCVLYGGGCVFLCFGALLAIIALCVPTVTDKRLTMFSGYIQTMATLVQVAGLLVYPLGLNSTFVQHYCFGSDVYHSGSCTVGWAYMLGIMSTGLAMFCPFLSHFTDMKVHESDYV